MPRTWAIMYVDPTDDHNWKMMAFSDEDAARRVAKELYGLACDVDLGSAGETDFSAAAAAAREDAAFLYEREPDGDLVWSLE